MKKMKMLSTTAFRLMALMLCLAASVPQLHADVVVAGSNTSLFGGNWDTTPSSTNRMTQLDGTNYYYLAKTNVTLSGTTEWKVVDNGSWYPGSNMSFNASGTRSIVFIYDKSSHNVSNFGPFQTLTVAGSQTEILGSSWGQTDSNNDMSTTDGINYTLSFTDVHVTANNYEFKVVQDHAWTYAWPSSNKTYSIGFTGTADVTFTFNVVTKDVSVTVTEKSVTPPTPHYYITGDNGLGLNGFTYQPTLELTDPDEDGTYTYTSTVTADGTYNFVFANGQGSDWNNFNSTYRIGPTNGDTAVPLNTYQNTQLAGGDNGAYQVTVAAGTVTFHFNPTAMTFMVEGTAPVINYFVKGADTSIFPDGWSTSDNNAQMTDNGDGTYSWTSGQFHANAGSSYTYKVYGSDDIWHPLNSGNQTFSADVPGTYTVTITYDSNNETVSAQLNIVQLDPMYTYNIYVRYTGIENMGNVYLYSWDGNGTLSDAWSGNVGGTPFSSLTIEIINGYTYYHATYTTYDSTIGVIFNENGNNNTKTADLTAYPGDNYFTYGGGSTVTGPNTQADARTDMYLIGYANSQQWAANNGIQMEWDEDNNYYKLEGVVLTSRSNFAFATQLAGTSDDWSTLNAYRLISTGDNNWNITVGQLDTWINYSDYKDSNSENHNWYVEQAGSYDIFVNPATRKIMVATRHNDMYISHGVNWTYENNSDQMTTVDGNV